MYRLDMCFGRGLKVFQVARLKHVHIRAKLPDSMYVRARHALEFGMEWAQNIEKAGNNAPE